VVLVGSPKVPNSTPARSLMPGLAPTFLSNQDDALGDGLALLEGVSARLVSRITVARQICGDFLGTFPARVAETAAADSREDPGDPWPA
jgi:hypothetical protein